MENYLLISIKNVSQTLYPPKVFSNETVKIYELKEDEAFSFINKKISAPSDWKRYGFAWINEFEVIIDVNKYKKDGHKNYMSPIWKKFIAFENINKLLRSKKLQNI